MAPKLTNTKPVVRRASWRVARQFCKTYHLPNFIDYHETTYQDAMDYKHTHEKTDFLTGSDLKVVPLNRRSATPLSHNAQAPTLPTTTAAQIMFARPNSVEDNPRICPRMLSQPTTHPTIGRCRFGTSCAEAVYLWLSGDIFIRIGRITYKPPQVGNALTISAILAPVKGVSVLSEQRF